MFIPISLKITVMDMIIPTDLISDHMIMTVGDQSAEIAELSSKTIGIKEFTNKLKDLINMKNNF